MEYKTIAGNYYTITSKTGCTVTDTTGTLSMTVDAGGQLTVQAPSDKLVYDDEQAIVFKANFKSALAVAGLLGGGADKLPAGYTRVEFLESTGSEYIDLGIPLSPRAEMECVSLFSGTASGALFGAQDPSSTNSRFAMSAYPETDTQNAAWVFVGTLSRAVHRNTYPNLSWTEQPLKCSIKNDIAQLGEEVELRGNTSAYSSPLTCWLFSRNRGGQTISAWVGRVYTFKLRSAHGGCSLIPALDPSGEPRMYDLVSKQAFRNAGTGQFIAGMTLSQVRGLRLPAGGGELTLSLPHEASIDRLAQVALERARANGWELTLQYAEAEVPAGYRRLDFLESTGTQRIDTGVKLSNESEVRVTLYTEENDAYKTQSPYGWDGDTSKQFYCYSQFYNEPTQKYISIFYLPKNFITSKARVIGKCDIIHNAEGFTVNGIKTSRTVEFDPFETTTSCLVFAARSSVFLGRIYSFSLSRAGEMQVDYVPCISPDGALGMYNKVDGTVKENAGRGAFIAGLATVDDVRKLWLPETGGELTVSVPADTPDSAVEQLRKNNPTWQIAIQYRTDNEN